MILIKIISTTLVFTLLAFTPCSSKSLKGRLPYQEASLPIDVRVEDLLGRMTLHEKIMQLNQGVLGNNDNPNNITNELENHNAEIGSVIYGNVTPQLRNSFQRKAMCETRLGIPILFGYDVIHGFRTLYPIPLGQACSFNTTLTYKAARMAAREAYAAGVDWTFSPMVDVSRDPRWGRVMECYGEDPYVNACLGAATVRGYQGNDLSSTDRMAACMKHYVAYGASTGGRDYTATEVSRQSLWDTYLQPFQAGIEAGALTVMASFNDISGTPAHANRYTLTTVLKEYWGHKGFVVSDWAGVAQLRTQGMASDEPDCAALALNAGVEMDMVDGIYRKHLEELVNQGRISMKTIDEAVRRILRVKFQLGLFERPYTEERSEQHTMLQPEAISISAQLAAESFVLLKNTNNLLPLHEVRRVAVVGPMANTGEHLLSHWGAHGRPADAETLLEGMKKQWKGRIEIEYAQGCDFEGNDTTLYAAAVESARRSDVAVICLGEKKQWSGENNCRADISLTAVQKGLLRAVKRVGRPVVLILSSGRPVPLGDVEPLCDAILSIWKPGIAAGTPLADMLTGAIIPSGKQAMTFPYATQQIPLYYNFRQSARPYQGHYQDMPSIPLYEFGHGLSYTTFSYSLPTVDVSQFTATDTLTISVDVTNKGKMDGQEIVLWYITDPASSITRPVKELKHFEKRLIPSGATQRFTFTINPQRDLSFPDADGHRCLEPGKYLIHVGPHTLTLMMNNEKVCP